MEKKLSLPEYEKPKITTYTSEDIQKVIGEIDDRITGLIINFNG